MYSGVAFDVCESMSYKLRRVVAPSLASDLSDLHASAKLLFIRSVPSFCSNILQISFILLSALVVDLLYQALLFSCVCIFFELKRLSSRPPLSNESALEVIIL